uniref:Uncharacterized protein n=1 Tax=Physcomitrium patens TaxID=3218 RepID=A0A7I3Z4U5_PHYPA
MRKLSQLDKNISQINEMMTMFNRKRISLCKLEHERADHGKYFFGLSLPGRKKNKRKRRKPERHRSLVRHVATDYETRAKS